MEIYIIRHTPVSISKDYCYGQSDIALAESYEQDIAYFLQELPKDFDFVYCSPLSRCKSIVESLEISNVKYEPALMEMNFGSWEGKRWRDINTDDLSKWGNDFVNISTPHGESLSILYSRVTEFLNQLSQNRHHKKILMITHAGVIRCLWAYFNDISLQNIFSIPISYQEIFIAQFRNDNLSNSMTKISILIILTNYFQLFFSQLIKTRSPFLFTSFCVIDNISISF
ncbi:MAG: alpha-ribazole phosphatase [Chitinophagales bacterium]|nr:alpha-ribazole phosphatase [Chitinophagales bacterium]